MDSNLTVSDAKNQFARFNYTPAEFLRRLNRASFRFLNSDVFTDIYSVLAVNSVSGYFSIPRGFGRAYGANQWGIAVPVASQWTPFTVGMIRYSGQPFLGFGLQDIGNQYPIQQDVWVSGVRQPGTLRWTISNSADAGSVGRFFGTSDANGTRIYDPVDHNLGLNVTAANPSVDTTQVFYTVDGIQFPVDSVGAATMIGGSTLSKVIATVATQIGSYEPGETRPQYQHYYGQPNATWLLFCKRLFVFYKAMTDWVYPANLDALEHAFEAQTYKDRHDAKEEAEQWKLGQKVLKEWYASQVPYPDTYLMSDSGHLMFQKFPMNWWGNGMGWGGC